MPRLKGPSNGYKMSHKKQQELKSAINKYNKAVRAARANAGFTDYNIDGLAMPTTFSNTFRRIENTKQANKVIKNLLEYAKPGMTDFVVDVDETTGEVKKIEFKAQNIQIKRQTQKENKIRKQARDYIIKNQDENVYNPQIRYTLPDVDEDFIARKHGISPIELGTNEPVVSWRTERWKENYTNRLLESLKQEQMENGVLPSTVNRVNALINAIKNASVGQINLAIYGTTLAGDIKQGPYSESVSLYLDTLEEEWNAVLGGTLIQDEEYGEEYNDDWDY